MNEITTKNKVDLNIEYDATENKTNDATIFIPSGIRFERKSYDTYVKDAKRILDKESKSLNPLGIERLIAALVIEVFGNDNHGCEN